MIIKKQDEEGPSLSIYGWKIETPAPKGIFVARCLDVAINEKYTTEKESESIGYTISFMKGGKSE